MQYMTHSVWKSKKNTCQTGQSVVAYLMFRTFLFCHTMAPRGNVRNKMRLLGQAVKTSPFHGGNTGSIPVGVIEMFPERVCGPLAQLVRATGS